MNASDRTAHAGMPPLSRGFRIAGSSRYNIPMPAVENLPWQALAPGRPSLAPLAAGDLQLAP